MLKVGKWWVGYDKPTGGSTLLFEFADRGRICLLVSSEGAVEMARQILYQHENPPIQPNRVN
jgi:hypothetical protein